jgi:YHS domain-containing protein
MAVDPEHAVGRLTFDDTAYFFCTLACAAEFAAHPERFPHGVPVPPSLPTAAWINKPATESTLLVPEGVGS